MLVEEFTDRVRNGESPTVEDYALRYPNLANEIRDVFPALLMMEQAQPEATHERGLGSRSGLLPQSQIGDYRVVRKVGQGGMGVVYEAEQESLNRRVALKVLPHHIANDKKFIERFKREARAAAKLHHTNIVPVFDVGQEGNTFYYAMQFIEGQPLDDVQRELIAIHEDKSSTASSKISKLISGSNSSGSQAKRMAYFKSIATIAASVADALGYAHERSIIHRDVKPSNLLLDTDGVIWLADFGLAKTTDSELTETGDFVGTARYMSPERFQGTADHLGDIYGLGVTLYELATLKKAFTAENRLQLMDQIANVDPRRPIEINRHLPIDLETIVLKAMEKEPKRRYQSAAEMSADLRRFVDDQPIHARRATLVERVVRWMKRHKAQTAAMFSMAAAILILVVSSILVIQQRNVAQTNFVESEKQKKRADGNAIEANREAKRARDAVKKMLTSVADVRLRNIPMMDGLRKKLLEEALEFNQAFLKSSESKEDRHEAAAAHRRLAEIYSMLEKNEQVESEYSKSRELFKEICDSDPEEMFARELYAETTIDFARHRLKLSKFDSAAVLVLEATSEYDRLFRESPEIVRYRTGLAVSQSLLAVCRFKVGKIPEANENYEESIRQFAATTLDIQDEQGRHGLFEFARTRVGFAHFLLSTRRPQKAMEQLESSRATLETLIAQFEEERNYRESLADCINQMGSLALKTGKLVDAQKHFERAVDVLMKLASDFPQIPNYRLDACVCLNGLAIAHAISGENKAAEKEFERAVKIIETLIKDSPEVRKFRFEGAHCVRRLAVHYLNDGRPQEAIEPFAKAYGMMQELVDQAPEVTSYQVDLSELAFLTGTTILKTQPQNREGPEWAQKAIDLAERLATDSPEQSRIRHKLGKCLRLQGIFRRNAEKYDVSEKLFVRAIEIHRQLVKEVPEFEEYHRHLAISLHELSEQKLRQKDSAAAEQHSLEALALRERNEAKNPNRFDHSLEMLISRYQLGQIYRQMDKANKAIEQYEYAINYCKKKIDDVPEHSRFRYQYLVSIQQLIEAQLELRSSSEADKWFKIAIDFYRAEQALGKPDPEVLRIGKEIVELREGQNR